MQAASLGIPFQPVRGLFGTDVAAAAGFATVRDPYSGEVIYVVPPIRPDWAVLHVHEADEQGNARLYGSPGYDLVMAEAAAHVILTTERLVPSQEFRAHPEQTRIPGIFVSAGAVGARGAAPCGGMHALDVDPQGDDTELHAARAE